MRIFAGILCVALLSGCATVQKASDNVCAHKGEVITALNLVMGAVKPDSEIYKGAAIAIDALEKQCALVPVASL